MKNHSEFCSNSNTIDWEMAQEFFSMAGDFDYGTPTYMRLMRKYHSLMLNYHARQAELHAPPVDATYQPAKRDVKKVIITGPKE